MSTAQMAYEKRKARRERDDDDADMQPSDEEPACEECGAERPSKFMHYCGTCNAYVLVMTALNTTRRTRSGVVILI